MDGDNPSLYPDEPNKHAVVKMDEMKQPDSDDFIVKLGEFEDDGFELPVETDHATHLVHTADGETITRSDWEDGEREASY